MVARSFALVGLLAAVSCTDDPRTVRKTVVDLGEILIDQQGRPVIDAPATAQVGAAFSVSVTTVGDECFSVYSTEVEESADGGDLTPYDRQVVPVMPNSACPLDRIFLVHSGTFEFATAGTKTVTVHGGGELTYPVTVAVQ